MAAASSADHAGWFDKKPTSQASREWSSCTPQKRYFVTRGSIVQYFASEPSGTGAKPNGTFDLGNVTLLRPARTEDRTAPPRALECEVDSHHFVLDLVQQDAVDVWVEL
jgi:hypothetical protein